MTRFNIANMFIAAAQHWRDRPAIESDGLALTHEEFIRLVMQMARHLQAHGIREGDRVGIALADNVAYIASIIAIWIIGAVAVPLNFRSKPLERMGLTKSHKVKFILETRCPEASGIYTSVPVGDDWMDVIANYSNEILIPKAADQPAILSPTSGTTGEPQLIQIDHHTWHNRYTLSLGDEFCAPGIRLINPSPATFSSSRNRSLYSLLFGGAVMFMPPLYSTEELTETIRSSKADIAAIVPTVLRQFLALAKSEKHILFPDLKALKCGGASISGPEKCLAREHLCPNIMVTYGSTSTGSISVQSSEEIDMFPDSVGRPHHIVFLQVVDRENKPLPPDQVGAIRVRSPGNASQIHSTEPVADDNRRDREVDGWVYPGDIGSLNESGYLTLQGRGSTMINRGGVNVFPDEIEKALNNHPGVQESAVVGQPSRKLGEEIVAYVIAEGSATPQEIMAFCQRTLSPDKRPRRIILTDDLPRNAAGKVVRRELTAKLPEID